MNKKSKEQEREETKRKKESKTIVKNNMKRVYDEK